MKQLWKSALLSFKDIRAANSDTVLSLSIRNLKMSLVLTKKKRIREKQSKSQRKTRRTETSKWSLMMIKLTSIKYQEKR